MMDKAELARLGVMVKPLEFEPVGDSLWAKDQYGDHYEVDPSGEYWTVAHPRLYDSIGYLTPDIAKAAAQTDYESRICAALAPIIAGLS